MLAVFVYLFGVISRLAEVLFYVLGILCFVKYLKDK